MELDPSQFDPITGATVVTLGDGVGYRMEFTTKALRMLEAATHEPYFWTIAADGTAERVLALVYAGCAADAMKRRKAWTLDAVTDLVAPRKIPEFWKQARESLRIAATPEGEAPATSPKE